MPNKAFSVNLLHNWYFPRPVNQRGVSGTITATGYFIDRWKLISGSVTIADDGLMLNGTIVQILEFDTPEEVVGSVLTTTGNLTPEYDAETRTFTITATGQTLVAAKLEMGTAQTLYSGAALLDPPPDYGTELLKCQRYYFISGEVRSDILESSQAWCNYYLPTSMRTNPSVVITPDSTNVTPQTIIRSPNAILFYAFRTVHWTFSKFEACADL